MSDEIFLDGARYVSALDAARWAGLSRDYVTRLCKRGEVHGRLFGKSWYVEHKSFQDFLVRREFEKTKSREELSRIREREYARGSVLSLSPTRAEKIQRPVREFDVQSALLASLHKHAIRASAKTPHVAFHAPFYTVTPLLDAFHKAVALITAFMLTFGTYAFVDPSYAREVGGALARAGSSVLTFDAPVHVNDVQDIIARAVDNPSSVLAAAGGAESGARTSFAKIAANFNRTVNEVVYRVAFPATIFQEHNAQSVVTLAITEKPVRAPASSGDVPIQSPVVRVVERIVEPQLFASAGVTEAFVRSSISELEARVSARFNSLSSANSSYVTSNSNAMWVLSRNTENIDDSNISDSDITGGTITDAAIEALSLEVTGTATSTFAGGINLTSGCFAVNGTCISAGGGSGTPGGSALQVQFNNFGSFDGDADFTFSTSTKRLTFLNASSTNFTTVNATTTSLFATYASTTNATSTNLFASVARLTSGIIDTLSATVATITNLTATTLSATNATTTRIDAIDYLAVGSSATTTIYGSATSTFGAGVQTTYLNVTGTSATSTFANGIVVQGGCVSVNGACLGADDFSYPFPSSATTSLLTFSGGLMSLASTTVGNGTQAGGLTISGGATTTGNAYFEGNIGIGASDPLETLFAQKSVNNSRGVRYTLSNTNTTGQSYAGAILYAANQTVASQFYADGLGTGPLGTPGFYVGNFSNHPIGFFTDNTEKARLSADGNLGIGTTSPYAKLSVAGQVVGQYFTATSSTASVLPYASSTALTVSGQASTSNLIASNSFTFSNVTGFLKATAGAVATAAIDLASDVTGILPVANGGTGWANIAANTLLTGNGTGAVATTTIGNGLSLSGGVLATSFGTTTANTWIALQTFSSGASTTQVSVSEKLYVNGSSSDTPLSGAQFVGASGWWGIRHDSNSRFNIDFNNNGTPAALFSMDQLGFLGVGTSSQFGTGLLLQPNYQATTLLDVLKSDGTSKLSVSGSGFGTTTVSGLNINGSATSTSNVGFNLTGGCFAVNGACFGADDFSYPFPSSATTSLLTFSGGLMSLASTTVGNGTQAGGLTISGGATTTGNAYFASNVGIGTTNPSGKLDIQTSASGNQALLTLSSSNIWSSYPGTGNQAGIQWRDSSGVLGSIGVSYNVLSDTTDITFGSLYNGGYPTAWTNPAMVLKGNGNLGIGTTSPYAKLSVAGQAVAEYFTATSTTATSTFGAGVQATALNLTGSATSTAANGFDLTAGCFSVNGTCITSGSGGSSASSTLLADSNTWSGTNIFANITASQATTSSLAVTGLTSALSLFDANGQATEYAGSSCTNQFVRSINGAGVATCASVQDEDLNLSDITLADFTNDANYAKTDAVNSWTALQSFTSGASTTRFSVFDTAYFGGTSTTTISSNGTINVPGIASGYQIGGSNALYASTTNNSVVVGPGSGASLLTQAGATRNSVFGSGSLTGASVSGDRNNVFGSAALLALTSGSKNQAIGVGALTSLTEGWDNVAIGDDAGYYNVTGSANLYIGQSSGRGSSGQSNSGNVGLGYRSLYGITTGGTNTTLGYQAGYTITSGSNNVILGYGGTSGGVTSGSNNVLIGYDVQSGLSSSGSNQLNIGNLLFGSGLGSGTTMGTGNIGVGTSSPYSKLSVWGNASGNIFEAITSASTSAFTVSGSGFGTTTVSGLTVSGSATSTSNVGWNLTGGCYAINGTCLGGGASLSGTTGQFAYFSGTNTAVGTSTLFLSTGSNVGIGTSSPYAKLTVWGAGTGTGTLFELANSASTTIAKFLDNGTGYFLGNIGIGTTTPYAKLSLTDAVSTAQVAIAYDATRYTNLLTNSVGDLVINPQGDDAFLNDDNFWVCTGGSCPSGNPTGTGNLVVENKQGIGTTTPDSKLSIETQDATTDFLRIASTTNQNLLVFNKSGFLGIGTSTPTQQLSIAQKLFVANGTPASSGTATSTFLGDVLITGKLDVSTIDPVYTIDGVKYATYGHSTVGVKEELAMLVEAEAKTATGKYEYVIDFKKLPLGSDPWLFWQVSDFGADWKNLVVSLTPGFDGQVSYVKDTERGVLRIIASAPGEVSLRLIADRFDAAEWPTLRPDQNDGFKGFELEGKK